MAIGTVTVVSQKMRSSGDVPFQDIVTMVGDSSYPTGGMTGLQTELRKKLNDNGREIVGIRDNDLNGGYICRWIDATGKVMLLKGNGSAVFVEETAAVNVSAITFRFLVESR